MVMIVVVRNTKAKSPVTPEYFEKEFDNDSIVRL